MLLRSGIAVAVVRVSGYRSNLTPNLGTSICHEHGPKETKKKKEEEEINWFIKNISRHRVNYVIFGSFYVNCIPFFLLFIQFLGPLLQSPRLGV